MTPVARTTAVLNAYAIDLAQADLRIDELEAERDAYRAMMSILLERLSALSIAQKQQRDRIARLLIQLRQLRDAPERAA